jgi:predicted transcriptional regulator
MVREFVDRVFDGAAGGLLAHLAKDSRLSKVEREHIRRVIEEMDE